MLLKSKLKATGIHFSLSLAIFAVALYLIVYQWYPSFLFRSDGGWQGIRIMAGVDLVLGPLLTFIIFNPNKSRKALLVDFTFIGVAQIAALAWGFYTVHEERPIALVHWHKSFNSITVKSLRAQGKTLHDLTAFGTENPRLIFAKPPEDETAKLNTFITAFTGDLAEYEQYPLFNPLQPNFAAVAAQQVKVEQLSKTYPEIADALAQLKAERGNDGKDWVYVDFRGKYENRILVFDAQANLIGALPADPTLR